MLSVYIDFVRFGAACVVVLTHAWLILFPDHPLPWPGNQAVIVFFVLSGLVIARAAERPGLTLSEYAVHRIARIESVAIPALVLSGLVSVLVGGRGFLGVAGQSCFRRAGLVGRDQPALERAILVVEF